ncbi:DUF905 family protein [Citrobacter freundii]
MGSCAAPSAKGDDKFITTDYLQQCPHFRLVVRQNGVMVWRAWNFEADTGKWLNRYIERYGIRKQQ